MFEPKSYGNSYAGVTLTITHTRNLCVGFRIGDAEIKIDSFYLARRYHNRGLGAEILKVLLAEADALGLPCELDVLLGSPADRFYERHGFVKQSQDDIEANFRRPIPRG